MKLSEYQYIIEYLKDDQNLIVNTLSRNPVELEQQVEFTSLNVFGVRQLSIR